MAIPMLPALLLLTVPCPARAETYPAPLKVIPSGHSREEIRRFEEPGPAMVRLGRTLYVKDCARCHGIKGGGDGPDAKFSSVVPRDFLGRTDDWVNGNSGKSMYVSLTFGLPHRNISPRDQWNLTPKDRWALIHYLHSLNPKAPRNGKRDELYEKALEADGVKAP